MDYDFTWLVGRILTRIESRGHGTWYFGFGDSQEIRGDCPWRLIRDGQIILSSEDHGHKYGLEHEIDAEAACRSEIGGAVVLNSEVRDQTRDLVVGFANGSRLELIPLSSGYESWQVFGPGGSFVVAQGGGGLAVWVGTDS